ncbi:hypothetical protein MLX50_25585, partial [Escherichia coli]|nr:hypothetical protein [Escherichia coli]MCN3738971.1 hypothetical protein [Escherichia coli]MCN4921583.1 hypothetical protein [Escherichia coli]MCN6629111.1 hypothetical protein [Escherichia coli]MCN9855215.1 hypothetical protein [Escherichia coli]
KERLMTIAERLRQEGHQIGWQEGKIEGWQEGKLEGLQQGKLEGLQKGKLEGLQEGMHEQAIKIALRMLEQGFEREIVLAATQLTDADIPNCH